MDEANLGLGMGMGKVPLQYFQVSFVSSANLTLRRQREYSGPVESSFRMGTPGRRGEVCNCIGLRAPESTQARMHYSKHAIE
jgi:hypothetical protein